MVTTADLEVAAQAWVVVLSATLLLISIAAYARSKNVRMLGLTAAFGFFLVKGILMTLGLLQIELLPSGLLAPVFLDTAILVSIYLAALRPR